MENASNSSKGKGKEKSQFGVYFDYDLSKMANSKGGYLIEDGNQIDEEALRKEKVREQQRALQSQEPRMIPSNLRIRGDCIDDYPSCLFRSLIESKMQGMRENRYRRYYEEGVWMSCLQVMSE
jgi:DNA-repair protein complementing XP-A cells